MSGYNSVIAKHINSENPVMFEFFRVMFEFFIDQYFKLMNRESKDKRGRERSLQRRSPTQSDKNHAFLPFFCIQFFNVLKNHGTLYSFGTS